MRHKEMVMFQLPLHLKMNARTKLTKKKIGETAPGCKIRGKNFPHAIHLEELLLNTLITEAV